MVVPGTYSGQPIPPGASGRQAPGLGTAAGAALRAAEDKAGVGVADGA